MSVLVDKIKAESSQVFRMTSPLLITAKKAGANWMKHSASSLGAALAYYSIFSLGPMILIISTLAGALLGPEATDGELKHTMEGIFGSKVAQSIELLVLGAKQSAVGSWQTIVGTVTLVIAATSVVIQLKDSLNMIWEVPPSDKKGVWSFLRKYVISLAMVLGCGFLLMISTILTSLIAVFGTYIAARLPLSEVFLQIINISLSFGLIWLVFSAMFKLLPDTKVRWSDVWTGAFVTALLFTFGKTLIGLYLGTQALDSSFGAAGSVILLLLWVYYSSQLFLFGAEFTHIYAQEHGSVHHNEMHTPQKFYIQS